jgi:hypothetical protein
MLMYGARGAKQRDGKTLWRGGGREVDETMLLYAELRREEVWDA